MRKQKEKTRKRFILCVRSVLTKLALDLQIDPSDLKYALWRLQQEGITFVTKILPAFSKYALRCCSKEQQLDARECGLTHFELLGRSPRFMRGLLLKAISGDPSALFSIRQFCEYFYKAVFDISEKETSSAILKYLSTDKSYDREKIDWVRVDKVRKLLETAFPRLCSYQPHELYNIVRPHDGPGSFARANFFEVAFGVPFAAVKRLPGSRVGTVRDDLFPYAGYFRSYPSSPEPIKKVSESRKAELLFVPKDSRGPRTISKEPLFLLRAQMAAGKTIARLLEEESHGHINFTDQTVNQEIARVSSMTGENLTADMAEASDRTWLQVCRVVSRNIPILRHAIRLRSTHVTCKIENEEAFELHKLKKLANMGSGICFPFLALMIYITTVAALVHGCRYSLKKAMKSVNVFGDDLEAPSRCFGVIRDWLESVGYVINEDKSYAEGHFRESCGGDYYHGVEVGPARFRFPGADLGSVREYRNGFIPIVTPSGLTQADAHARELRDKGLNNLADYFTRLLERPLGPLPFVSRECPYIGRYDPSRTIFGGTAKVFMPVVQTYFLEAACPYKGLGQSFASSDGLLQDWCLTPLRRKLTLKRRVPDYSVLASWGLPQVPEFIRKSETGSYPILGLYPFPLDEN